MKFIPNNTFEVDNITCINHQLNMNLVYKCIYITESKFEFQLMNLDYYKNICSNFTFNYIHDSGNILVRNGNISIPVEESNNDDIKVFFNNYTFNKIYKIKYNIIDNLLNISICYINTDDIIKENVYIKYYNRSSTIYNINIKNFTNEIHTLDINTPFIIKKLLINYNNDDNIIPKTIMQTYKTRYVNRNIYNATRTWTLLNPSYKYIIFDDEQCRKFIKNNFQPIVLRTFDTLIPGAFKADLFRYCYLYKEGGVYTDIDNICLAPLDNIIAKTDSFVSVKDRPPSTILNAFMAGHKGNPVLHDCIKQIVYNVTHRVYFDTGRSLLDALTYTGPRCLGIALNKYLNRNINTDFKEGNFEINNMPFKLFNFIRFPYIMCNNTRIIKMKYEGYESGTNYWKLASEHSIYK